MKSFRQSFIISSAIILLVLCSFISGYLWHDWVKPKDTNFLILGQAYQLIIDHGYDPAPPDPAMEYGMIQGMIQAYGDPYTNFLAPVQNELETNSLQGKYGGIGVDLGKDPQGNFVLYPFSGSPAANAGIIEGDHLLAVDQLEIGSDTSQEAILAAISGPVGQKVILTIAHAPEFNPEMVSIERVEIFLPSVSWHLDVGEPRVGLIKVNIIADTTIDEITQAISDMSARGATHYILDLRDNYGGLLDAGINIARLFLDHGVIIEEQYRGREIETFNVQEPGPYSNLPLVILVNQNTASAAEIIAGSLKVQQRAILIGIPTYGKDTIQLVYELHDGSSMHITAAHWWIPGLNPPLSGNGLEPDIFVQSDNTSSADQAIQAAIQYFFNR
jgi:carboxyl-terminal processing protease